MPNLDKTGPTGKGPKTGRGLGDCEGATLRPDLGRGLGLGRGLRRGLNCCPFGWRGPQDKKSQLEALGEYKKALKTELLDLEKKEEELK